MNTHSIILPLMGMISGQEVEYSPPEICLQFGISGISLILLVSILSGKVYLIHFLFTLPMRRAERARLFLDLLEGAMDRGQAVEEMILSVAQSRDRTVGVHFHVLAAHIENGLNFTEALQRVPRIFPPQILAILAAGQKLGDLKKVLPACREILRDRPESVRSAMHYMILAVLVFSPAFIIVTLMTTTFVIPKFRDVAAGMGVKVWPETLFVFNYTAWLLAASITVTLLIALAVLSYIGGPRLTRWVKLGRVPIQDWLAWHISWKQKRLLRTFSAMLSVLLDGGVPETEAVSLAGACTANEICRIRSQRILVALAKGVKLDDALRHFDDSGDFHWRMTNAARARGGFLDALRGWHQALDAKAFQQEEATAHLVTSGVVVFNGALVALIATAMFWHFDGHFRSVLSRPHEICHSPIAPAKARQAGRGFLQVDLVVALAHFFHRHPMPLGYAFVRERQVLKIEYQKSVADEIVDGEMEILAAGAGRIFSDGSQTYPVQSRAATALPPGHFELTKAGNHLRLAMDAGRLGPGCRCGDPRNHDAMILKSHNKHAHGCPWDQFD